MRFSILFKFLIFIFIFLLIINNFNLISFRQIKRLIKRIKK